jgi:hypothetical protein
MACNSVAAQRWLPSRRLRSATRKPASTSALVAITGRLEVFFLPPAQVARQSVDRADNVGDGLEQARPLPARPFRARQSLAHHVGLRQFAPARLSFDLGDQAFRQPNRQCLHDATALHGRHRRHTSVHRYFSRRFRAGATPRSWPEQKGRGSAIAILKQHQVIACPKRVIRWRRHRKAQCAEAPLRGLEVVNAQDQVIEMAWHREKPSAGSVGP